MSKKIWFGKPGAFQYMPCPATGINVTSQRYSETLEFMNGGASVVRSTARHRIFDFDFPVQDASQAGGLDVYSDYSDGVYGLGPWYFSDPMAHRTNVLSPSISYPGLIKDGWPDWFPTAEYSYFQAPLDNGRPGLVSQWFWNPEIAQNQVFKFIVPKPPDCTAEFGFVGGIPQNVTLQYRLGNSDGTLSSPIPFTIIDYANPNNINATIGTGAEFVEFEISGIPDMLGNIAIHTAMFRIIDPNGASFTNALFTMGRGSSAVEFDGEAIVESYVMEQRHLKGMSFQMREVGLWR